MARVGPPSTGQRATVDPCGAATSGRGAGRGPGGGAFCLWRRTSRALLLYLPSALPPLPRGAVRCGGEPLPQRQRRSVARVATMSAGVIPNDGGHWLTAVSSACSHHNEATRLGSHKKKVSSEWLTQKGRHTKRNACVVVVWCVVCGVWCMVCGVWYVVLWCACGRRGREGGGWGEGERVWWWWWCGGRGGRREEWGGVCVVCGGSDVTKNKHTHASMHLIVGVMSLWTRTPRPAPVCRAPKTTVVSLAASRQETPSTPPWGRTAVQHGVEPCKKKNSPVCMCRSLGKRKGVLHQPARLPGVCARVPKVDLLWGPPVRATLTSPVVRTTFSAEPTADT